MLRKDRIYLIGMPASGKSNIGKMLATKLNKLFLDLDLEIEKKVGEPNADILNRRGEAFFREQEAECLRAKTDEEKTFVMAVGGGTPCFYDNLDFMLSKGSVLWVNPALGKIKQRLRNSKTNRPLVDLKNLNEYIDKLFFERSRFYRLAHSTISGKEDLEDVVKEFI